MIFCIALTFALMAACAPACAQNDARFGLGAAINPITLLVESDGSNGNLTVPVQTAALFLPMQFSEHVRIEPQFSLLSLSVQKTTRDDEGNTRGTLEGTTSGVMLGTGIFYGFTADASTRGYAGIRVGVITASSVSTYTPVEDETVEVSYSQTNVFYGPALGGEYYLSGSMSLGMELGLNVLSYGSVDYETTPSLPDPSRSDVEQSAVSTGALVFVRFYLF